MPAKRGNECGEALIGPVVDGGIRGLPPSTLRQISKAVGRGTLASAGRMLGRLPWGDSSGRDRVVGLAMAQMWAQARLMGAVLGTNELVTEFLYATCDARS